MAARERVNVWSIAGWPTIALVILIGHRAVAAEPKVLERQTREFKVSVDGKPRGKCTIEIQSLDDGADVMHIDASLSFNYVVYEYRYASAGTEVWKNGRLLELENTADFNGTKYVVSAAATRKGLRVTVDGKAYEAEPGVWVTSYWRLPEHLAEAAAAAPKTVIPAGGGRSPRQPARQTVALLDSDKGRKLRGELKSLGEETIEVAGRKKQCARYKISGDVSVDVWYDAELRLVRQEAVESGHKTVMELTRITAE